MSDVANAETQPEPLSPADFGMPDEGEVREPANNPNLRQAQEQDDETEAEEQPTGPEDAGEVEAEADPYAEAPEFWSKERKALYAKITDPDVRKAIHEQESEARTAVSKKMEEAAQEKKSAAEKLQQYESERDQLAQWWQDTGPKLASAFRSKWDGVNWADLAENNPAEYVKQQEAYKRDAALIQQAAQQNERAQAEANDRAKKAHQEARRTEHEKLAKDLPEYFGKPDVAQKTYDELSDYLVNKQGVPADRIQNIFESFVVRIALNSMLYDKAQAARASATTQQPTTATQTPRRIAPGASQKGGQPRQSEAYRQARERLNNGGPLSAEDAAVLFA